MKISSLWLKEHIDHGLAPADLRAKLLSLGFEVEAGAGGAPTFSGVVVGRVLTRDKHPNADRLSVCVVDDGAQKWSVVCGAPNVAAGLTVAFARVGAVLPGDFKIAKAKLRGVESQGMICSREELGLPKAEDGIWILGEGAALGSDVGGLLAPADDVFEVDITSNRPDCLSHRGLARELSIALQIPLKELTPLRRFEAMSTLKVRVEDAPVCPYYSIHDIPGVAVEASPAWLKGRLESIGLRPINNVVDVTNFILHDLGQPLHAFDADKVSGAITVRRSVKGEKFLALDHKTYDLKEGTLVIADDKGVLALAGVMGGEASSVTAATKRVALEGAFFAPPDVRRTVQRTRLRSDSSYRFERGVDLGGVADAAARAATLIATLTGGKPTKSVEAAAPKRRTVPITSSSARLNHILGATFSDEQIMASLKAIAAQYYGSAQTFEFTAPTWRRDLSTASDLAEEVARLVGYDKIPVKLSPLTPKPAVLAPVEAAARRARLRLSAAGLCEAYNYDFLSEKTFSTCRLTDEDVVRINNPLSEDWACLRTTLLPGLLKNAQHNASRGTDAARLFEIGKAYKQRSSVVVEKVKAAGILFGPVLDSRWQTARAPKAGVFDGKAILSSLFADSVDWLTFDDPSAGQMPHDPMFHPTQCLRVVIDGRASGTLGLLHPRVAKAYDLERENAVIFEVDIEGLSRAARAGEKILEISSQPASRRDIAIVVGKKVKYAAIETTIRALKIAELKEISLFDVYEGAGIPDGKKSLALHLTFAANDRTLTVAEVNDFTAAIIKALADKLDADLRQ